MDVDAGDTDYTITDTRRTNGGYVVYHFTDRYGQRYHVTVTLAHSVPEFVDPTIRRMIANHRPKRRTP